jgi:hypothetical protein
MVPRVGGLVSSVDIKVTTVPRTEPAGALGLGDTKDRFTPTPVLHDLEVTTTLATYRTN